jgi:hypothetical protein
MLDRHATSHATAMKHWTGMTPFSSKRATPAGQFWRR